MIKILWIEVMRVLVELIALMLFHVMHRLLNLIPLSFRILELAIQ